MAAVMLVGCGDKSKDKPASQTAAKVNKEEITVHQINFLLAQQRGVPPEQAASASKLVLERLIDQELALQKAQDQKIDRDARVVQQIEAARREIIARAYFERIGAGAAKPTPSEVHAYYDSHPALFKQRRVYNLQELAVEATPERAAALRDKVASAKDIQEVVAFLRSGEYKFAANQAVRGAEQLPMTSLDKLAALKDGQSLFTPTPKGAQVVFLAASRSQPIDEPQATPAIEQFLLVESRRKMIANDLKSLRTSAKVEYVGDYAKDIPVAPAASDPVPAAAVLTSPADSASMPMAAPQFEVAPIEGNAASAPSDKALEKGIKGFK